MNYETLKKQYLDKLENIATLLSKIDTFSNVLEVTQIQQLHKIKDKNLLYLEKLKKGEIEVAIIGAENGGKSTFANAFVKLKEAFPTGSIRTTYTSTKLKYGEDKGIVTFYNTEEFDEIFNELLEQVKYQNRNGLKNFDINHYKSYFENLKQTDKKLYDDTFATINKDIVEIAEGKEIIFQYLNQPPKYFDKNQIENQELKKFITDKYIARSVKNIDIKLSSFEDTKEMVLYDVPGFDSLTEKHKIETKKSLDMADAIILIKNIVESPNIRSHEADILKSYDENGLPLYEKLFAFGTQIDKANNQDDAKTNIETFKIELKTHLNIKENRIFYGSAFAYMQKIGLENGDNSISKMREFFMEDKIDIIDDLREAIKNFYKNEVFNNIKKQIDMNINELKSILDSVVSYDETQKLQQLETKERYIYNNFLKTTKVNLENNLSKKIKEIKEEIIKNKELSDAFVEKINNELELEVNQNLLEDLNIKAMGYRNADSPMAINLKYRETNLLPKIKNKFFNIIIEIAKAKYDGYMQDIISHIKTELKIENGNLEKALLEYIDKKIDKEKHTEISYTYLINRFSADLFDAMIKSPKGTQDRQNIIDESIDDFKILAVTYENSSDFSNFENSELLKKILNSQTTSHKRGIVSHQIKEITQSKTLEEVAQEIADDVKNIKEILIRAVIPLIKLELPFLISIHNQIDILKQDGFEEFITEYFHILKETELNNIKYQKENIKTTIEIIKKIEELKDNYLN